jgi:hypothetical protein
MKVQVKKRKKSWTHEGPRKKDSHVHKRVKIEREEHTKWSYKYPPYHIHHIPIHAHLDLIV